MSLKGKILFVAHDPGAAEGLAPVIRLFQIEGYDVQLLADGPALEIWERDTLEPKYVHSRLQLSDEIDLFGPNVVVTGTSFHSSFDYFAIEEAEIRGLPTFSFIDAEMNLRTRFVREGKECYPRGLGVITQYVKETIESECWYKGETFVVGQPYLEQTVLGLRERKKQTQLKRQIVFVSEPIDIDFSENKLGYTQFDVATLVREALEVFSEMSLVIQPHPREDKGAWGMWLKQHNTKGKTTVWDGSFDDIISSSEWVCGMHSMGLIVAALSGCKSVALLPCAYGTVNPLLERVEEVKIVQTVKGLCDHIKGREDAASYDEMRPSTLSYELMHQADWRCMHAIISYIE